MKNKRNNSNRSKSNNFSRLSIFQPNRYRFRKTCPLSSKGAPIVDYKNIKLLKRYVSENGKILPSRITNISQKKQRELSLSIKRANVVKEILISYGIDNKKIKILGEGEEKLAILTPDETKQPANRRVEIKKTN